MGQRIQWIDLCKGLGICLVVLGHTLRNDLSLVYIYGFHMPLFFFLSGIVCNTQKYTWSSFIKSRFNSLIIPYIFVYLLTYFIWLVAERSFRDIGLRWWEPIIGMLYGAQWHGYMAHNGVLWFLPCLFSTEMLCFAITRIKSKLEQGILVIVCLLVGYSIKSNLPWCLNIALVSLLFFYIGNRVRYSLDSKDESIYKQSLLAVVYVVAYIFIQHYFENKVNMATADYGVFHSFLFASIFGIWAMVSICRCFTRFNFSWIQYLGRNTLIVFALHQPLLRVYRYLGTYLFSNASFEYNLIHALLIDIIVFITLIPIISLYNKYMIKYLSKLYLE